MKELKDLAKQITVNFMRVGFDPSSEQTKFVAVINGETFDFHCGLMACIPATKQVSRWPGDTEKKTIKPLEYLKIQLQKRPDNSARVLGLIIEGRLKAAQNPQHIGIWHAISALCEPTAWDLLYCLQSDAQAASMSFDDWCSDFGYDNDSIKALNTYNLCVESARKLKKALGPDLFKEVMEANPE